MLSLPPRLRPDTVVQTWCISKQLVPEGTSLHSAKCLRILASDCSAPLTRIIVQQHDICLKTVTIHTDDHKAACTRSCTEADKCA